jgi:uncharacterized protein
MSSHSDECDGKTLVPLFPLPNIVLFPGAILPLHIFEPRYKRMTADVLDGDGLVAMALLRAGWEKDYYSRAAIEPVVCVGKIVAHEKLPDGNYNYLLQGQWRGAVLSESRAGGDTPYRVGKLVRVEESPVVEIDVANERQRLMELFEDGGLGNLSVTRQFARLLSSPMHTAAIADLIAFHFLQDPQVKQSLLADGDVPRRVGRIVSALDEIRACRPAETDQDFSLN